MLTRAELKTISQKQLSGNWGVAILSIIILSLVNPLLSFIPYAGPVAGFILSGPLVVGVTLVFLKITKAEKPQPIDIFDGFQIFGNALLLNVLITIFTFLWSLLLIIPGIVKGLSYSMSYYILTENPGMSANEALNISKKITMGHKAELFVLMLSFIWWYLLTGITCGIAGLYVIPYVNTTLTNYYHQIKEEPAIVNDTPQAAE